MPRDGAGQYSLPAGNPVTTQTVISSTVHNNTLTDIATALTNSIAKDGQTVPTADLPMGGNKHTAVADAVLRNQYASAGQVQDGSLVTLSSVAGTDTITGSLTPSIATSGLQAGMVLRFLPANTNTGAATLNVNSIGAKDIKKWGANDLVAGDLAEDVPALVMYDGTQFQLLNPLKLAASAFPNTIVPDAALSANIPKLDASNTFTNDQTVSKASSNASFFAARGDGATVRLGAFGNSGAVGTTTEHSFSIMANGTNHIVVSAIGTVTMGGTLEVTGATTLTGGVLLPLGSASAPSVARGNDPDTGLYFPAGNTVGLSAGNSLVASFSQSEIDLTATTLDFNGNADISGTLTANGAVKAATIASSTSETLVPGQIHHIDGNATVPTLAAGQWVAIVNHSSSAITLTRRSGTALYWTLTGENSATVTIGARGRAVVSCAASGSDYVSGDITGNTT